MDSVTREKAVYKLGKMFMEVRPPFSYYSMSAASTYSMSASYYSMSAASTACQQLVQHVSIQYSISAASKACQQLVKQVYGSGMTYADVCRRRCPPLFNFLTYAHVCSRMLTYAHVCSRILTYAEVC
jgi:hypothetical protein